MGSLSGDHTPEVENDNFSKPVRVAMQWNSRYGFKVFMVPDNPQNSTYGDGTVVAWANFTNAINQTGWSFLEIRTSEDFQDEDQVVAEIIKLKKMNTEFRSPLQTTLPLGLCCWIP